MLVPHAGANGTSKVNALHFDEDSKPAVTWTTTQEFPRASTLCTDEDTVIATMNKFFMGKGSEGCVVTGKAHGPPDSTLATDCYSTESQRES